MTTYHYVSVMQAKNDTEAIPEGNVIIIPGKKPDDHIEEYIVGQEEFIEEYVNG